MNQTQVYLVYTLVWQHRQAIWELQFLLGGF